MIKTSATKLSRAFYCGKWAGDGQSTQVIETKNNNPKDSIKDGNFRHILMEYYIKKYASINLSFSNPDISDMADNVNWNLLNKFLKEKSEKIDLPVNMTKVRCIKVLKKLSSVLDHINNKIISSREVIFIGAEVPIFPHNVKIFDDILINSGKIDALITIRKSDGSYLIVIIDWKRSLSRQTQIHNNQGRVYSRCVEENPILGGLSKEDSMKIEIDVYLYEVGGENRDKPDYQKISTSDEEINEFLSTAKKNIGSSIARPGIHCSSHCKWLFSKNYCREVNSSALEIDFHNPNYWKGINHRVNKKNTAVQITIERDIKLKIGIKNNIKLRIENTERTICIRNIKSNIELKKGQNIRLEGTITRETEKYAFIDVLRSPIIV